MSPEARTPESRLDRACVGLATLFGVGKIPKIPGTAASAVTVPLLYLCIQSGPVIYFLAASLICALAIPVSTRAERVLGRHDPGEIVIDEVAGMFISAAPVVFLPACLTMAYLVAAFVLFRIFDIGKKPRFISRAQNFPGGTGIVLDDILAGFCSAVVLALIFILQTKFFKPCVSV